MDMPCRFVGYFANFKGSFPKNSNIPRLFAK